MVGVNIIIAKHEFNYSHAMADHLLSLNASRGLGHGLRMRRGTAAAELPEGWRAERYSLAAKISSLVVSLCS